MSVYWTIFILIIILFILTYGRRWWAARKSGEQMPMAFKVRFWFMLVAIIVIIITNALMTIIGC